jgi:hypothetical protein
MRRALDMLILTSELAVEQSLKGLREMTTREIEMEHLNSEAEAFIESATTTITTTGSTHLEIDEDGVESIFSPTTLEFDFSKDQKKEIQEIATNAAEVAVTSALQNERQKIERGSVWVAPGGSQYVSLSGSAFCDTNYTVACESTQPGFISVATKSPGGFEITLPPEHPGGEISYVAVHETLFDTLIPALTSFDVETEPSVVSEAKPESECSFKDEIEKLNRGERDELQD